MKRVTTSDLGNARIAMMRIASTAEMSESAFELEARVHLFEAVTWFPRIQAQILATKSRGMSALFRGIKVMTWCCGGRCLIQFERENHQITLITAEDEAPWQRDTAHVAPFMGPMGLQYIDADYCEALKIIYEATRYGSEITLTDDPAVTMAGL